MLSSSILPGQLRVRIIPPTDCMVVMQPVARSFWPHCVVAGATAAGY